MAYLPAIYGFAGILSRIFSKAFRCNARSISRMRPLPSKGAKCTALPTFRHL